MKLFALKRRSRARNHSEFDLEFSAFFKFRILILLFYRTKINEIIVNKIKNHIKEQRKGKNDDHIMAYPTCDKKTSSHKYKIYRINLKFVVLLNCNGILVSNISVELGRGD